MLSTYVALPASQQGAEDLLTGEGVALTVWLSPNADGLGALLHFRMGYREAGYRLGGMWLHPQLCGWDGHAMASQASITESSAATQPA